MKLEYWHSEECKLTTTGTLTFDPSSLKKMGDLAILVRTFPLKIHCGVEYLETY